MPQLLAQIHLHIIFSTKNRHPFLADESIRDQTTATSAKRAIDPFSASAASPTTFATDKRVSDASFQTFRKHRP